MKSTIVGGRMLTRAAAGAVAVGATLAAAALPAQARTAEPAAAKVDFAYSSPEIADAGDKVTWHWTIKNSGTMDVHKVVLTHKLTPMLKMASVSPGCKALATAVRCEYGLLAKGVSRTGTLVAQIPAEASGTVQINGRVTWQQGPVPAAGQDVEPAVRPAVEQGSAPAEPDPPRR
ncbi:hypothetical protein [Spirillospora sp. CA-294931]|uniref:hypothetical protein n=1 Tax=Spirillospora sp. CA-294931 TaxID=3240042 RepID=UPI003D92477A